MAITAADVKKLRDATGAGMMDAKKALTEADGDFEAAVEILRVTGQAKMAKRSDREASNGLVASAGKSVLVVERGNYAGAKNMTGGRIYSHSLKQVFPDFESEAPVERKITHERIAMMDPKSQMTVDFTSSELGEEGKDSYSVLRAPFDQWLASKAEDAGAEYICGIAVEELLKDGSGRVVGVRAGEDEITAEVVVVAEGVNSLLCERSLGNPRPKPSQMAVGIKQVFELPASQIEDRFLCPEGEGAAMLFVGDCTHGNVGGGFLYTNRDSISLGLVATVSTAMDASNPYPVYQMLEDFKNHPAVAPVTPPVLVDNTERPPPAVNCKSIENPNSGDRHGHPVRPDQRHHQRHRQGHRRFRAGRSLPARRHRQAHRHQAG